MKNLTTEDTENTERENDLQCELAAWELLREATRERDEAREVLRSALEERDREWFQIIESIAGFHPVSITDALQQGIARAKNLKRERDEAREELNRYKRQWEESRSENVEGVK